jgi:cytochrome c
MVTEISCSSKRAASRIEHGMPRALGFIIGCLAIGILASGAASGAEQGDPARGARVYRACAACHSLEPDKNMTGPSLAGVWNRKAGSLASFSRYSPALKSTNVVWDQQTLDAWLKDPRGFIPQNRMTFAGVADDRARADLVAFLKEATQPGHAPRSQTAQQDGGTGGMSGMMGGDQNVPDLKKLEPGDRVTAIVYCRDTYRITTGDGETHEFWERNLRFKTDSSSDGPDKGVPAILGAGMMGDRASVIFADPAEIAAAIRHQC